MTNQKAKKSKYIGKIYEGRWKVIEIETKKEPYRITNYVLENIFNHSRMVLKNRQILNIEKGLTTISKIIAYQNVMLKKKRRIYEQNKNF